MIFYICLLLFFLPVNLVSASQRFLPKHNCLEYFMSLVDPKPSFGDLNIIIKKLTKKDLKCLFKASQYNLRPRKSFFVPQSTNFFVEPVARIIGKNSLFWFSNFEKRTFVININKQKKIFGTNIHKAMKITGPGFFSVERHNNQILLNFWEDFKHDLGELDANILSNLGVNRVQNNHKNMFFGGATVDFCRSLIKDPKNNKKDLALICEARRNFSGCYHKAFMWDILIRDW